jgi:hypothetical protein
MIRTFKGSIITNESNLGKREIMSTVSQATDYAANDMAGSQSTNDQAQDFLLFCPAPSDQTQVMNAIHALYYLPKHYKLVVMKDASLVDGRKMAEGNEHLVDRILFETDTRAPGETPSFDYANAVICSEANDRYDNVSAPHITISQSATSGIEDDGGNNFTVPHGSPEALASAAMLIARSYGYALAV